MTRDLLTATLDQTVAECMVLMSEKHVRHLPVLDQERLVGIVSIGDIVKEVIAEQSATIGYLQDYITGKR